MVFDATPAFLLKEDGLYDRQLTVRTYELGRPALVPDL